MNITSTPKLLLALTLFTLHISVYGQTVYMWNTTNGDFQTSTNWTPSRTAPATDDILIFNVPGVHYTITNVPTQTVGVISIVGNANSGGIRLQPQTGANRLLSLQGGNPVSLITNNAALTIAGAGVSNQMQVLVDNVSVTGNANTFTGVNLVGTNSIISVSGIMYNTATTNAPGDPAPIINSGPSNAFFLENAVLLHARNGGRLPHAFFDDNSLISVTGIAGSNKLRFSSGTSYGRFVYNCPSQSSSEFQGGVEVGNILFKQGLVVSSTGTGAFTIGHNGTVNYTFAGSVIVNSGRLTFGPSNGNNAQTNIFLLDDVIVNSGGVLRTIFSNNTEVRRLNINIAPSKSINIENGANFVLHSNTSFTGGGAVLFKNGSSVGLSAVEGYNTVAGVGFSFLNSGTNQFDFSNIVYTFSNFSQINLGASLPNTVSKNIILNTTNVNRHVLVDKATTILGFVSVTGTSGTLSATGINTLTFMNGGTLYPNCVPTGITANELFFDNGGNYVHNINGGTIPTATWLTGSTCSVTGVTDNTPGIGSNTSFSNFVWNNPGQTSNCCGIHNATSLVQFRDNLIVVNSGSDALRLNHNNSGNFTFNNISVVGGALRFAQFALCNVSVSGNLFLNAGANALIHQNSNLYFIGNGSTLHVNTTNGWLLQDNSGIYFNKNAGETITLTGSVDISPAFRNVFFNRGNINVNGYTFAYGMPDFTYTTVNHSNVTLVSNNPLSNVSVIGGDMANPGNGTLTGFSGFFNNITVSHPTNDNYFFVGNATVAGKLFLIGNVNANFNVFDSNKITFYNFQNRSQWFKPIQTSNASNLVFGENGGLVIDINESNVPNATWLTNSTLSITGITFNTEFSNIAGGNFYNIVWNCPNQTSYGTLSNSTSTPITIAGTLAVLNTNGRGLFRIAAGSPTDLFVNHLVVRDVFGGPYFGGTANVSVSGNLLIGGGTLSGFNLDRTPTLNINLIGSGGQMSIAGINTLSGTVNIRLDKNSLTSADGINLVANSTIPSGIGFSFLRGLINTDNHVLFSNADLSTASATNGWINGKQARLVPTGSNVIRAFRVGTANTFNPVLLTFPGVSTQGMLMVGCAQGTASNFSTSCISNEKYANLYWNINTFGSASLAPISFNNTFTFSGANLVGGANPSDFIAQHNNGSLWNNLTVALKSATDLRATGINQLGNFMLGEGKSITASITGSTFACTSAPLNLTATGVFADVANTFTWSVNGIAVGGPTDNVFSQTFAPNDVVSVAYTPVTQGCLGVPALATPLTITGFSQGIWLGTASTNFNDGNNWCGGIVPTAADDAYIINAAAIGAVFQPSVSTTASVKDLWVASGGSLTLAANATMNVNGNFVQLGNLSASNAKVLFAGSGTHSLLGVGIRVADVELASGKTLKVAGNVSVSGTIALGTSAIFDNGANRDVVLLSAPTSPATVVGTGRLAALPAGAQYIGNMRVQRYVPEKNAYRFMSMPVQDVTLAQLKQNTFVYSIIRTNPDFDNHPNPSPTLYWYIETVAGGLNSGWRTTNNINYTFETGRGYQVLVAGDRNLLTNSGKNLGPQGESSAVTLNFSGVPHQGDVSLPITYTTSVATADGWNLVGNPYASEIDWDSPEWTKTNIEPAIWFFDPGTSNTELTTTAGSYITYLPGVGCTMGRANCNIIASSQGFWVRSTATGASLVAKEGVKTAANHFANFRRDNTVLENLKVNLVKDGELLDNVIVAFNERATAGYDNGMEAAKLMNSRNNLYISINANQPLAISTFPYADTIIVPLEARVAEGGTYQLNIATNELALNNWDIYVKNPLTQTLYPINQGANGNGVSQAMVANSPSVYQLILVYKKNTSNVSATATNGTTEGSQQGVINGFLAASDNEQISISTSARGSFNTTFKLFPNPAEEERFWIQFTTSNTQPLYVKIFDIQGMLQAQLNTQTVMGENVVEVKHNLPQGVYSVWVTNGTASKVVKLLVK